MPDPRLGPTIPDIPGAITSAANVIAGGIGSLVDTSGPTIDLPGYGRLQGEQVTNARYAAQVAKRYGIPETLFLRLLAAESGLRADPGGNGGGIGQFIPSTAAQYGTTQAELRGDVNKAIDLAARLLNDNRKALGTEDWIPAAAAYFVGPSTVAEGMRKDPNNWIHETNEAFKRNFPKEAASQGLPSQYLQKLGVTGGGGASALIAPQTTTPGSTTRPTVGPGGIPVPNFDAFIKEFGDTPEAYTGYYDALAKYNQLRRTEAADMATYLDIVGKELDLEIGAGNLSLAQANAEFARRMDAFTEAGNQYEAYLPHTIPSTSVGGYLPNREPGGFYERQGLPPQLSSPIAINPFQMAQDVINQSPAVPNTVPDLTRMTEARQRFEEALRIARSQYGAQSISPPGGSTGGLLPGAR